MKFTNPFYGLYNSLHINLKLSICKKLKMNLTVNLVYIRLMQRNYPSLIVVVLNLGIKKWRDLEKKVQIKNSKLHCDLCFIII